MGLAVLASVILFRAVLQRSLFFDPLDPESLSCLLDSLDRETLRRVGIDSLRYLAESREISRSALECIDRQAAEA